MLKKFFKKKIIFFKNWTIWPFLLWLDVRDGDIGNRYGGAASFFLSLGVTNFILAIVLCLSSVMVGVFVVIITTIIAHMTIGIIAHFTIKGEFGDSFLP